MFTSVMFCWKVKCVLDNTDANQYIEARVAELTRLRETFQKDDRHYYALSAGIFELIMLQQHLCRQH